MMAEMTEEEANTLDEAFTKNPPVTATAAHKTPAEIINDMIRERMTASA
jgi:hypothetical protein